MIRKAIVTVLLLAATGLASVWFVLRLAKPFMWECVTEHARVALEVSQPGALIDFSAASVQFSWPTVEGKLKVRKNLAGLFLEYPVSESRETRPIQLGLWGFHFQLREYMRNLTKTERSLKDRAQSSYLPYGPPPWEGDPPRPRFILTRIVEFYVPVLAVIVGLLFYPMLVFIRGPVRRWRRRKRGACVHCVFDLTGNVSGVCPECGTETGTDPAQEIEIGQAPPAD
ncbi:MAG: hypothetical protein KJ749_06265 [Planctomycetes bacterium]|nr:hypothetical protein [Planctomycetota bacterium]